MMSLLFNMLFRLVIAFLPRSQPLFLSWLQSPYAVILEPQKTKSLTVSTVSPSICIFTTNKASGGDGIPVELFKILKDDAVKVLHSICQHIWKTWPGEQSPVLTHNSKGILDFPGATQEAP